MFKTMQAADLFEATETALAIAGLPEFNSADSPGQIEVFKFVPGASPDEDDSWALVPKDADTDEYVAIDVDMALQILLSHLRGWLLQRGWQVQVHVHANVTRWELVDCLSAVNGGGDRLDVDYPYGPDELTVLVQSVIAVNTIQ